MKVLLLGGTGNISTAITRQLLKRRDEVTLLKRTAALPAGMEEARVLVADRTDSNALREAVRSQAAFDCVIDMLCYRPEEAEAAIRTFRDRTRQYIFCSTVDVYSKEQPCYPVTEKDGRIGAAPGFRYAFDKVECERLFWNAHHRGDFAVTVLRPAFTYNEGWSPGIHSFGGQTYHLDRLRKGLPVILHGDGNSIWTATHRDDTAAVFVSAAGNEVAYGQAYNVSGDEWMTQNHIWKTLARLLEAPEPEFVYIPAAILAKLAPAEAKDCLDNFQYNNIFDTSKAKRDLGFRYTIRFEEGASRCIRQLTTTNAIESWDKYPFYDRLLTTWRNMAGTFTGSLSVSDSQSLEMKP